MGALVQYAALCCVAAGLISGALALLRTGDAGVALRVALDLWLAAGLLRLAAMAGWEQVLSAAAIVAVRHLVGRALHRRADAPLAGPASSGR